MWVVLHAPVVAAHRCRYGRVGKRFAGGWRVGFADWWVIVAQRCRRVVAVVSRSTFPVMFVPEVHRVRNYREPASG